MNNKNLITLLTVVAGILGITVFAEYIYLKKVTAEKDRIESQIVSEQKKSSAGSIKTDADLLKEIESLEAKNAIAAAAARAREARIEQLEERLRRTASYAEAAIVDIRRSSGGDQEPASGPISFRYSTRKQMADKLDEFITQLAGFLDDDTMIALEEEFGAFIASLNIDQASVEPVIRRAAALQSLSSKIDAAAGDREKDALQKRYDAIANASDENLQAVLDYYQRLDDIEHLNTLMDRYNIGREELRSAGIEPPPRSKWGPDILEVAMNLDTFTRMYKPLVPAEKQEQFEEDFSTYLNDLTRRHSENEVIDQRNQWISELQEKLETSDNEHTKHWVSRRIEGLEKSSVDDVRKWIQYKKMGELQQLTSEYGIPHNELQQSGVMSHWHRSGRGRR